MADIDNLMTMFDSIANNLKYEKICEFSQEQKEEYELLLDDFIKINSSNYTTKEKGEVLEKIASFVLETSNIFDIYDNIRTTTNELDQLVRLNVKGKLLNSRGLIDSRLSGFIGECKNYNSKVSVTYVGKICSLMSTTQNKICILFSYHGITGNNWTSSSGLIRKFYLSKEKLEERYCIIDFNIKDFESIRDGNNFLQIVHDKIMSLQNDTDYTKLLKPHFSTEAILKAQQN